MARQLALSIRIDADGRASVAEINRVQRQLDGVRPAAQNASQGLQATNAASQALAGAMRTLMPLIGVTGLAGALSSIASEAEQAQRNMLRTEAILKSTGHAAGLSAKQLKENASSLALATLQSVEGVEQAQQILLTFKSVAGDTFIEATEAAANLATVTGGSLNSTMTQLGKALEDPVKGLTALRRSGVSFTESQKEMIKELVNTNQLAEAQSVILGELATQYGGVARREAEGYAGAVDTLGQRIQELKLEIADSTGLLETMTGATNTTTRAVEALTESVSDGAIGREIERWNAAAAGVSALASNIRDVASAVSGFAEKLGTTNPLFARFMELAGIAARMTSPFGAMASGLAAYGNAADKADVELGELGVTATGLAGGFNAIDLAFGDIFTSIELTGNAAETTTPKLIETGGAAKSAGGAAKSAAKEVDHLTEALTKQASGIDSLIGEYLPARAAQDDYTDGVRKAAAAHALGTINADEYATILAGLEQTLAETSAEATAAASGFTDAWDQGLEELGQTFEDTFKDAIRNGELSLESFSDWALNWLADLAWQFAQQTIGINFAGDTSGVGGMMSGGSSLMSGGLTGDPNTSIFSGGGMDGMTNMLGGNSMGEALGGAVSGIQHGTGLMTEQSSMLAAQEAGMGTMAGNLSGTSNLMLGGAGIAGGMASSMLFDFSTPEEQMGNTVGSAAGAAIGTAILPGIGTAIGSFLGGSGGGLLGGLFGGEEEPKMRAGVKDGEAYMGDSKDIDSATLSEFQSAANELNASMMQTAEELGPAAVDALNAYDSAGPHGAGTVERIETDPGAFLEQQAEAMTEAMVNATIDAIHEENEAIGGAWTAVWDDVLATVPEGLDGTLAAVEQTEAIMAQLPGLSQMMSMAGVALGESADIVAYELSKGAGGIDQASGQIASYYETFFSEEERLQNAVEAAQSRVDETFDALDMEVPDTMDAFRDLVESLDVTTESGQALYASLMGVHEAFALIEENTPSVDLVNSSGSAIMLSDNINALSESKRELARMEDEVADVFSSIGQSVPGTTDDFNAYLLSLSDMVESTEASIAALSDVESNAKDEIAKINESGHSGRPYSVMSRGALHLDDEEWTAEANADPEWGTGWEEVVRPDIDLAEEFGSWFDDFAETFTDPLNTLDLDLPKTASELYLMTGSLSDLAVELEAAAVESEEAQAKLDVLNSSMPLLIEYFDVLEEMNAALNYVTQAMSDYTSLLTENAGELQDDVRGMLEDAVYEGIDAGPAFAEMIEGYIIGTLLDNVAQMMQEAVVTPLIESAASSAMSIATGGTVGGAAVQTGGMLAAEELAAIVDQAVTIADIMGQVLSDNDFQDAMDQVGEAINSIGGGINSDVFGAGADWLSTLQDAFPPVIDHVANMRSLMEDLGLEMVNSSEAMSELAHSGDLTAEQTAALVGELDTLTGAMQRVDQASASMAGFADKLDPMTQDEAQAKAQALFSDLDLTLPTTSQAMADFLRTADLTAEQTVALGDATEWLGMIYQGVEADARANLSSAEEANNAVREAQEKLNQLRAEALQQEVDAMQEQASELRSLQQEWETLAEGISDWVRKAQRDLVGGTEGREASYRQTLDMARAGDQSAMSELTGVASAYIDSLRGSSSSEVEFQRLASSVIGEVDSIEDVALSEAEIYKRQAERLERRISDLNDDIDVLLNGTNETLQQQIAMATLDLEQKRAEAEIANAYYIANLDKQDEVAAQIVSAINELDLNVDTEAHKVTASGGSSASRGSSSSDPMKALAEAYYKGTEDYYGSIRMTDPLAVTSAAVAAGVSMSNVKDAIGFTGDRVDLRSQWGFAKGGIVSGPTSGYQLDAPMHGTEAIIPLGDGNRVRAELNGLSFDGMISELKALREEVSELRQEQRQQHHASYREQRDTADTLKRWEIIGPPNVREDA